jgi:hypothetical protein
MTDSDCVAAEELPSVIRRSEGLPIGCAVDNIGMLVGPSWTADRLPVSRRSAQDPIQ